MPEYVVDNPGLGIDIIIDMGDIGTDMVDDIGVVGSGGGGDARVRDEDHPALVEGLLSLQKEGVLSEVHIVRGNGSRDIWEDRMSAISRSQVRALLARLIDRSRLPLTL